MFVKDNLWCESGEGKIQRILSFEEDGCVLYSWMHDSELEDGNLSSLYLRRFNPNNNRDDVVLICRHGVEIISAFMSPDKKAVAFTMWLSKEVIETKTNLHFDFITKSPQKSGNLHHLPKSVKDAMPLTASDDKEKSRQTINVESKSYQHGVYRSFLAEVFPTGWTMKFNTDRKLPQRVLFTNHVTKKSNGDLKLTTYEALLILHRESIGLYNVMLQDNSNAVHQLAPKSDNTLKYSSSRVYGRPTAEVVVDGAIWSQWDSVNQRLYYLVPLRRTKANKTALRTSKPDDHSPRFCQFACVQFYENIPLKKVIEIQMDFDISRTALFNRSSLSAHDPLNPTISSLELNMRLCVFSETGVLCLCWQVLSSTDNNLDRLYSIAILDKELCFHYPRTESIGNKKVFFLSLGHMLVVQCPGVFLHLYDIKNMSCDKHAMANGLYDMQLPDACFPALHGSALEFVMHTWKTNDKSSPENTEPSVFSDSVDSLSSTASDNMTGNTAVCYDNKAGSLVVLKFSYKGFKTLFEDKALNIKNRVFLTRFAVASSRLSSEPLSVILDLIINHPTNPDVTAVLAQFLISATTLELIDHKHSVPPSLLPLFPTTIPTSCLSRFLADYENPLVEYTDAGNALLITKQTEQYLASVSLNLQFVTGSRFNLARQLSASSVDGPSLTDRRLIGRQEAKESLWYRTLNACRCGSYPAYDLECIREELTILSELKKHAGKKSKTLRHCAQSGILLDRLAKLFERDFLKRPDGVSSSISALGSDPDLFRGSILSFLNENERDQDSECIIVLTSEKLCDHLSAYLHSDPGASDTYIDVAKLSRDYIYAQMRAVHHVLTLMMLKSAVEDFECALFVPASDKERRLLTSVNQFQLVCSMICFPLPNGFQTFVTCLTFRRWLSLFPLTDLSEAETKRNSAILVERFFALVDEGFVQLTAEFVARALEELGDKKYFSDIVYELLARTRDIDSENCDRSALSGIEQWHDPRARKCLAKASVKELFATVRNAASCSSSTVPSSNKRRLLHRSTSSPPRNQYKEVTVPTYLKSLASTKASSISTSSNSPEDLCETDDQLQIFSPLQHFLEFVKETEQRFSGSDRSAVRRISQKSPTELIKDSFTHPSLADVCSNL